MISFCLTPLPLPFDGWPFARLARSSTVPWGLREVRGYLSGEAGTNRQQLPLVGQPNPSQVSHTAVTAKELNPKTKKKKYRRSAESSLYTFSPIGIIQCFCGNPFNSVPADPQPRAIFVQYIQKCLPRSSVGRYATGELRGEITERSVIAHHNGTYQSAAEIPVLGCE